MIYSFITADPLEASAARAAGIQRIMIDLERKGKADRQKGRELFLSDHRMEHVSLMNSRVLNSEIVVRINPLHDESDKEVAEVIERGADYVMLPFFHHVNQVETFHGLVKGKAQIILLIETASAANNIEAIISAAPPDEMHIGLNDLSISLGKNNIFTLFRDGTVASIAARIRACNLPFGIGGIGALSRNNLPITPKCFYVEQLRLGATRGWLGRSFREPNGRLTLAEEFRSLLLTYQECQCADEQYWHRNHEFFMEQVACYGSD